MSHCDDDIWDYALSYNNNSRGPDGVFLFWFCGQTINSYDFEVDEEVMCSGGEKRLEVEEEGRQAGISCSSSKLV